MTMVTIPFRARGVGLCNRTPRTQVGYFSLKPQIRRTYCGICQDTARHVPFQCPPSRPSHPVVTFLIPGPIQFRSDSGVIGFPIIGVSSGTSGTPQEYLFDICEVSSHSRKKNFIPLFRAMCRQNTQFLAATVFWCCINWWRWIKWREFSPFPFLIFSGSWLPLSKLAELFVRGTQSLGEGLVKIGSLSSSGEPVSFLSISIAQTGGIGSQVLARDTKCHFMQGGFSGRAAESEQPEGVMYVSWFSSLWNPLQLLLSADMSCDRKAFALTKRTCCFGLVDTDNSRYHGEAVEHGCSRTFQGISAFISCRPTVRRV